MGLAQDVWNLENNKMLGIRILLLGLGMGCRLGSVVVTDKIAKQIDLAHSF